MAQPSRDSGFASWSQDLSDIPSEDEVTTPIEANDNNQSFPVLANSTERCRSEEKAKEIVETLKKSETKWRSVDCLGRRTIDEDKTLIRTTLVITFSREPKGDQARSLKKDLESLMGYPLFPVEFLEGDVIELQRGFKEMRLPLECGVSCGIWGQSGSGTIGGFITIEGDPDPDAVYALTNHHVVSPREIDWACLDDLGSGMRLPKRVEIDAARLELPTRGRQRISGLLKARESLNPPFFQDYGENYQSYVRDFRDQYLDQRQQTADYAPLDADSLEQRMDLELQGLGNTEHQGESGEFDRTLSLNDVYYLRDLILLDMQSSVHPHRYVLGVFIRAVMDGMETVERGRERRLLQVFLHRRRICRTTKEHPLIMEHPSRWDRDTRISSMEDSLANLPDLSDERRPLLEQVQQLKSDERLVGVVWASSGIYIQPCCGSTLGTREDWALIKLFTEDGQSFKNEFGTASRPFDRTFQFKTIQQYNNVYEFPVHKRGRSTGITGSQTNGPKSLVKHRGGYGSMEHSILPSPGDTPFAMKGDSGSWVIDDEGGAFVGMIWGMNTATNHVYFTPADYLCRWIEDRFIAAMDSHQRILLGSGFKPGQRIKLYPPPTPPPDPRRPAGRHATPTLRLRSTDGSFESKIITVPDREPLLLGRKNRTNPSPTPDNLIFDAKVVSKKHAEIWADEDGKIWIRDTQSSNGTWVNGARLGNKEVELQSGHELILGMDIKCDNKITHHQVRIFVDLADSET